MKYLLIILTVFFFALLAQETYADGEKYWKQKGERYEKEKKGTIQRGKTFNPNKYEEQERIRIENNSMSPLAVLLILSGIAGVVYLIVIVISGTQELLSRLESKHWLIIGGFILLLITIAILASNVSASRNSDYYDIPYGRVHTDGHY